MRSGGALFAAIQNEGGRSIRGACSAMALATVVAVHAAPRAALAQRASGDSTTLEISAVDRGIRGVVGKDSIRRIASGVIRALRGGRVSYSLAADTGYARLSVLLDGRPVPPTGTIPMDADHLLSVSAERVPRLVPQNRAMYDLIKQTMAAPDPRPLSHALFEEMFCAIEWYGADRARELHDDAVTLLTPTQAALDAYARMDSKLAGETYSPDCRKPRPRDATTPSTKRPAQGQGRDGRSEGGERRGYDRRVWKPSSE